MIPTTNNVYHYDKGLIQPSETDFLISYNIRYDNNWDIENSWSLRKKKICAL